MTMKMGVEALLKEEFPSMNELIDVTATGADAKPFIPIMFLNTKPKPP